MTPAPSVLVVASWYPSVDGLAAGRFVADQAQALRAGGRYAPIVVSFDPLALWGSAGLRRREGEAVRSLSGAGLAARPDAAFCDPATLAVAAASHGPREAIGEASSDDSAASRAGGEPPAPARAGVADAPVAWLSVPGNARDTGPADRAADDRARALESAAAAIDRWGPSPVLIHAHTGFPDGAAAAAEARRRGVPLVLTEHATYLARILADPVRRARYREAGMAAFRIIAVGRMLANQIVCELPELGDRVVVIPNVVDVDAFATDDPERDPEELLFVGNRKRVKGIGVLLDAFARARSTRSSLRLRLVGAAPASLDMEWLRRAHSLGVADGVSFEPETDRAGVAAAMAHAGLFVHPSPRETFGVVAAEALAAGLPVVATDSGGITEVLGPDPGSTGALVPANDAAALAAAILEVLGRRASYSAATLRRRAVERFGFAAVAGQLADLYDAARASSPHAAATGLARPTGPARRATALDAPPASRRPEPLITDGRPPRKIVVVGLDRVRAARILEAAPSGLFGRIALVTAEGPTAAPLPAGLARVRLVPGFAVRNAARGAVASVAATATGPRWRALVARPAIVLRELRERLPGRERSLLDAALAALGDVADRGDFVVALDGFDALVAAEAVRTGQLVPLPGAGRWLAGAASAAASGAPSSAYHLGEVR